MNTFTHNRHGLVRIPWRIILFIGLFGLFAFAIILGTVPLTKAFLQGAEGETSLRDLNPIGVSIFNILLSIAIFVASLIVAKNLDRRRISSLGLGFHSNWQKEFGLGLFLGAAGMCAIGLVLMVTGSLHLEPAGLSGSALLKSFLTYGLLFITVGFMEELLFRGFLLQALAEGTNKIVAALLLSLPFGILHFFNEGGTLVGAISTGLAGLMLCIAYFRTRSLWVPIGMHITWNFANSWILSLPVSGETIAVSPFVATVTGPDWWSGGSFGPEGSVLCFLAEALLVLFLLRSRRFDAAPDSIEWYPPPEERGQLLSPLLSAEEEEAAAAQE